MFWGGNAIIFITMLLTVLWGDAFVDYIGNAQEVFLKHFGWLYILAIIFLILSLCQIVYRHPSAKIGGRDAKTEFSTTAWISMLFSAGLGIGLLYSGTFEPLAYYFNAPHIQNLESNQKFISALHISYFHWGIPAWVIYSSTGLIMAISGFGKGFDFSFSSSLKTKKMIWHHIINIAAVISILFGVVTAFAMGAQQINMGLSAVFPFIPVNKATQAFVVAVITALATLSVLSGLKKGIRLLSLLNIGLALSILIYVFSYIPKHMFFNVLIETTGYHLSHFVETLTYTAAYDDKAWISSWTMLYWAWWASWAPFVGLFIARISKGRTVKEFFVGTVLAPSLICIIWITTFGVFGFEYQNRGAINFKEIINVAPYKSLFTILENTHMPLVSSVVGLICILIFYITSSDSGSYVIDMISSRKNNKEPNKHLKIYWSLIEGLLALVLIYFGGIEFIKNLVILSSLPIILYICYGAYRLSSELKNHKQP